ncbi:MAG: hypothetical protein WKF74_10025 [Pyrinomonadaceae bacterium]
MNDIAPEVLPERAAAETLRGFNVILDESDTARPQSFDPKTHLRRGEGGGQGTSWKGKLRRTHLL